MTLKETQKRMAQALMTPLGPSGRIRRRAANGELMSREAAGIIKRNSRLSSIERLEIYSRSYWFRLLGSLADDFPGLRAVLGARAFEHLSEAYLTDCPSQSFTLRDLGSRMEEWLRNHPEHLGSNPELALDMTRLEWAHVVAFDGPEEKVLGPEDLVEITTKLRACVQPYGSFLELSYAVDELRGAVNADSEGSSVASNVASDRRRRQVRRVRRLETQRIFLAVHRLDLTVYYRRLTPEEFRVLSALRNGRSISAAIRFGFDGSPIHSEDRPALLGAWFSTWAQFGWLATRPKSKRGKHSS